MMKVFTYSEARQNLSRLLSMAQKEEIEIRRKDGSVFILKSKGNSNGSPFDVPGIKSSITAEDVLDAVRESRQR
ncbi:MAG: hypothetical protein WEB57_00810 [Pseudohongiellaceae bacterium]